MELDGKRVVVTGGTGGLGRCMVEQLLHSNASVSVFDVHRERLDAVSSELPEIQSFLCDLTDPDQVSDVLEKYFSANKTADILINNAGVLYNCPLAGIGPEGLKRHTWSDWRRVVGVNLDSVFLMTSCVVERMIVTRTKGLVVNISSVSAAGNAGQSAYAAAKAGVNALTTTWARELGPMGIRVAGIAPGFIATESTSKVMSRMAIEEVLKHVPLNRLGKPDEIVKALLAVIDNDFFHGKVFAVDGGLVL